MFTCKSRTDGVVPPLPAWALRKMMILLHSPEFRSSELIVLGLGCVKAVPGWLSPTWAVPTRVIPTQVPPQAIPRGSPWCEAGDRGQEKAVWRWSCFRKHLIRSPGGGDPAAPSTMLARAACTV